MWDGVAKLTLPNVPRSPPFFADEQSECTEASCANFSEEPLISFWYPFNISMASSFVLVMFAYIGPWFVSAISR